MYSLVATDNIYKWLKGNMQKYEVASSNKTIEALYKESRFEITLYNNRNLIIKGELKDRIYNKLIEICNEENFLGCDEVGVGDFFGPTVYVAVLLDQEAMNILKDNHLTIKDSKKLKEEEILTTYDIVKDKINYSTQIIWDKDVQELNSVEQKVVAHHQNVDNILKQNLEVSKTIIDLFTTVNSFNKYSNEHNFMWPEPLLLETKADDKYLCVALASIIARAIFLEEMEKLNQKYNIIFPLGAGNVKSVGKKFLDQYSSEELATFAKVSFKTFNEIVDNN